METTAKETFVVCDFWDYKMPATCNYGGILSCLKKNDLDLYSAYIHYKNVLISDLREFLDKGYNYSGVDFDQHDWLLVGELTKKASYAERLDNLFASFGC